MKPETPLAARAAVRTLAASKIRELYNEGVGRTDVLAFWVGEPDEPTPEFIRKAGVDSIGAGELFYTHNLGIPELRAALAAYVGRLHKDISFDQVAVTSAGVNALMLAGQLLLDPGDRVVEVVPLWPNLQEIPKILGAGVASVLGRCDEFIVEACAVPAFANLDHEAFKQAIGASEPLRTGTYAKTFTFTLSTTAP